MTVIDSLQAGNKIKQRVRESLNTIRALSFSLTNGITV